MLKNKKYIKIDKSLVVLIVVFLVLFFLKALLYGLFGRDVWVFIANVFSFIPENILLYAFFPIWYIFMRPILWVLSNLTIINPDDNKFIAFSLDIGLTIIYLTILFFLVKSIFNFFKKKAKSTEIKYG
ncbi:MAG: hypothetical protein Q7R95_10875 [bacterium]|nr:hypothetical protein [bacterium]